MDEKQFCLNDYDCIGFDMDHTIVQYVLPQTFKLLYKCAVDYLVDHKGHCSLTFNMNNYERFEDFSLRGIIFDIKYGNFIKLDKNGYVLSCTHGLKTCSDDEIVTYYGIERKWQLFEVLKENVYHADGYMIMENFFLMPAASILAQLVEDADQKNNGKPLSDYRGIHEMVSEALLKSFHPSAFKNDTSHFFTSLKKSPEKYVKKLQPSVLNWLKYLRKKGKVLALITDSFADFASHLMEYAIGPKWKEEFDFIVAHANKPNFFKPWYTDRYFVNIDECNIETNDTKEYLKPHTLYCLGNAWKFEESIKHYIGKDQVKVVYFGDSMKSDVYPPKHFVQWDTVAVLEEMEAEEVHFRKNHAHVPDIKRPEVTPLLKEEKLLIASSQWGSFFTHPNDVQDGKEKNDSMDAEHEINTFWGEIIRTYSKLSIPLLDYLAETRIEDIFPSFTKNQLGFYPSPPRTLLKDK